MTIYNRLEEATGHSVLEHQFDFTKGCSTLDSMNILVNIPREAILGKWGIIMERRYKNTMCHLDIGHSECLELSHVELHLRDTALTEHTMVSQMDYFNYRTFMYSTEDGPKEDKVPHAFYSVHFCGT